MGGESVPVVLAGDLDLPWTPGELSARLGPAYTVEVASAGPLPAGAVLLASGAVPPAHGAVPPARPAGLRGLLVVASDSGSVADTIRHLEAGADGVLTSTALTEVAARIRALARRRLVPTARLEASRSA